MENGKKKVLIVHNYYQIPGGEDTVVENEKKLLEEHGHKVVLYTRHNLEIKDMSRLQKLRLPFTTIYNPITYYEIKRIIQEEHIDIVHVHNTLNLISPAVYYAAVKCSVPVIQTIHNFRLLCPGHAFYLKDHICEECVEKGLWCAVKHGCYRGSKAQTLVYVTGIKIHRWTGIYRKLGYICLTEFNREKLLQLKQVKLEKVFVKPNFVEADETIIPYAQREEQYIFAGRLDKLKGIDVLLKAWKMMKKNAPKLIICGTGPMEEWCKEFIRKNELDSIEINGFIPNKEVKRLIANSKALILPTLWYEGFPMSIVEAYSVGTPVICSDLGNAGSVVEEGVTGFKFCPGEAEELISAVKRSQDKMIIESVIKIYQKKYTAKHNYEYLNYIYNAIIAMEKNYEPLAESYKNTGS
ncbi:glycosyltransferase family 4 protein [Lachnospiraceae bacterium 62-35]